MSTHTGIAWTERTWNPVVGCTKKSTGCRFCYAKTLHDMRHKAHLAGKMQNVPQYAQPFEAVQLMPDRLADPLSWRSPSRVFVNSMSDLFHEDVPDTFLDRVFAVMALARRHSFQVLTKRADRMRDYVTGLARDYDRLEAGALSLGYTLRFEGLPLVPWPIPSVWLGVSVENQQAADERIPLLLATPATVRFLSCEPLIGPVDLWGARYAQPGGGLGSAFAWGAGVTWVIDGGESGKNCRPMDLDWARAHRDECNAAGAAYFLKQLGGHPDSRSHEKAVLDGRTWTEMPRTKVTA